MHPSVNLLIGNNAIIQDIAVSIKKAPHIALSREKTTLVFGPALLRTGEMRRWGSQKWLPQG
jgi:hypothetical protein